MNTIFRGLLPVILLFSLNLTVYQHAKAQSCPTDPFPMSQSDLASCTPALASCSPVEIEILSVFLEADPLLCVPCNAGDMLSANVYVELNNLSENNSAIGLFADLSDGANTCDFIKCNGPILAQSATPGGSGLQELFLGSISWVCGQSLSLQNITIVVGAPGNLCPLTCADTPVSCSFGISNLAITMPGVSIIPDPGCDDGDCTNGVETWDGCECHPGTDPVDPGCDDGVCTNGLEIWDGCDCQPGTPPVDPGCDDGNCTNGLETWDGCMCQPGTPPPDPGCDDGICANGIETWDGCNCVTGTAPVVCAATIAQSCNDNNPCTVNDTELVDACSGIVCVPCTGSGTMDCTIFTFLACDDFNPCTVNDQYSIDACSGDVCVPCNGTPVSSCEVLINQACDDGNSCTTNDIETLDACSLEICVPCAGIPVGPTTCDPNCEIYNPATCDCDPILVMDCDDNNCATIDNYNPITCSCENIPIDDSACDDGLCYTIDYLDPITCNCVHQPISDVDCDDYDCSTEDYFNYTTCECENVPECNNITNAGWIGYDQGNCSAFDPSPLVSLEPAMGGCGAIEYMWLKSNINVPYYGNLNGPWSIIPNENGLTYDPPFMASGVMCFLRCARTNTCTDFIGESNVVCITVGTTEVCNDWDCTTNDVFNTTTCECEYTVISTPNCDDNDCSTYDYFDAENCECVHEVTCDNVTYGGLITGNQESCGAFDPDPITSVTAPSGGCGGLEYLWIASTHNVFSGSSNGSPWYTVIGANGPSYDPGVLTKTTYFRRCARRIGCTSWIGESNIICIEVGSSDICDDANCATLDEYDPITCQCTNTPIVIDCDDNDCSTQDIYDPLTCLCTHVVIPPPVCNDNDCTTEEFYDAANCQCVYTVVELPNCDDNNCATADSFNQTTCECEYVTLPPVNCNDNDCNTIDSYNASTCSCENTPIDADTCDDNDCSTMDSYDTVNCQCVNTPIQSPIDCVIAPPATITLDVCTGSVDPAVIGGAPIISSCACADFTVTFTDVNVGLPNTDCLGIIRSWSVVSNCGCEDISLTYTQEILQFNQIGPSITVPADLTVSASNAGCTREVSLLAVAMVGGCSSGANAVIEPGEITNSFTDGGADAFAAYPLGTTSVTFVVTDNCGRTASGVTNVTVIDDISPTCLAEDVVLTLDSDGQAIIDIIELAGQSSDACGNVTFSINPNIVYTCADVGQDLSVELKVTDENGNFSVCTASVAVVDDIMPICMVQDVTLSLDADGEAVLSIAQIDTGSGDSCGNATLELNPMTTYTCADVGQDLNVQLLVTDNAGNTSACSASVTIIEGIEPMCVAQDVTLSLDMNGEAVINISELDNGSSDACGTITLSTDPARTYTCADVGENLSVDLVVTDDSGNTSVCGASVTVVNTIQPSCLAQDVTLILDADGEAVINIADLDNGSSSNCGAVSLNIDPSLTYTCENVGQNLSVDLIVTDESGNSSVCSASVTVVDETMPICMAQDVTLSLDTDGEAVLSVAQLDNGSGNSCGNATLTLSPVTTYTCADVGEDLMANLIVTDNAGNSTSCSASITIVDDIAPMCVAQDVTLSLNTNGEAMIDISELDNGSSDACGPITFEVNPAVTYTCADVDEDLSVDLIVTDASGNTSVCSASVTVVNNILPSCVAQDVTLFLDANGEAVLNVADLDNGSSSICGPVSLTVSPMTVYTCADVGQDLTAILIVTDATGNSSSCTAAVTVVDMSETTCFENLTIDLGEDGTYIIDPNVLLMSSSGSCTGSVTLSTDVASLSCNNLGNDVVVTLTATDEDGNTSTCMTTITVEVNIPAVPAGICPEDMNIDCGDDISDLSIYGTPDLTPNKDYCFHRFTAVEEVDIDIDDCGIGMITRTWTFLDIDGTVLLDTNGNVLSCSQEITIGLGSNPLTQADITCPADVFISCDETVDDQPIIDLSNAACSDVVITSSDMVNDLSGTCDYTIERTFTITDQCQTAPAGIFNCTQIITVQDISAPTIANLPADTTIDLTDEANTCSTTLNYVINITDDCSDSGDITFTVDAPGLISTSPLDASGNTTAVIEWCTSDSTSMVYVTATDACANVAIDSFEVVVIGEPCFTYFCEKFPFTLEPDGDIELDSDIWIPLVTSNGCSRLEIDIAYSSDITDTLMTYGCDDITIMNMGNVSDSIFFFVNGVLVDSCRIVVFFENDWMTICDDNSFTGGQIRGRVRNPNYEPVEDVDMQLEGSQFVGIYTNEQGRYAFPNMSLGGTYDVLAHKDTDHRNGVTTLDIVLTQRHILGVEDFNSPYQYIAADVNKSNNISAVDLIQMRKLILGVFDEFPSNTSWRMVDDAYTFPDPTDPLAFKFDESHYIFGFESDLNVDFTAVKIGDINHSATSSSIADNSEQRSNQMLLLNFEDRDFVRNETVKLEFYIDEYENLDGFQFALSINPKLLVIESITTSDETLLGAHNINQTQLEAGMLPISWNKTGNQSPKGKLIGLQLKALGDGKLSSAIEFDEKLLAAEAYFDREVADVSLGHNSMALDEAEFIITGLYPVPFRSTINLDIIASEAAEMSLDVYMNTGERITTETGIELKQGGNSYQWDMGHLPEGPYIFRFTVNEEVFVRKMIKLD